MVQFYIINLVNLFSTLFLIYQETLCYVCYIYKAKEINEENTEQSMLNYDSLCFKYFFLSVLAFMHILSSITNSVKWKGKLQIYIMCRYWHY